MSEHVLKAKVISVGEEKSRNKPYLNEKLALQNMRLF